ncbi:hypothetical protein Krac_8018 [Ktedonobacter racemifer DSM 44963]|uniref:Uncharacterized protein n=1 Tax=Ktedonobacter racemifer DSM 44963 TaxID=485913 RepID=D6TLQ7_KTERA|nr:hypothetical protein Krac_8018 [Ktedonobacter racemifer DSM 44963]
MRRKRRMTFAPPQHTQRVRQVFCTDIDETAFKIEAKQATSFTFLFVSPLVILPVQTDQSIG